MVALTSLSLTACSGSTAATIPQTTPVPAATTSSAAAAASTNPANDAAAEQSIANACLSMAGPITDASAAMAEIAAVSTDDPQSAVDAWTTLVDLYGSVARTVTNLEVKEAATAVQQDLTTLRDAMHKIYVDGDMSVMGEFTTATTAWQASQTALNELCAG
ncbi:hypothetical protein H5398_08525 [Tessaracoccus sp. MC1679]|uniref:hypothetical protein n=1 Tax=Tessaracoccus sp. MC1679 TaxID=2760313 RepID=UPI00160098AB|nr:hypothetical protein [Tessaracoccus sp. MC1679]MBB1516010.1 hypothetical protein [Tessaracoccus sp. MC1679]